MVNKVSVVVVTRDRPEALAGLLGSLQCQTLSSFDLVIVLNGPKSWHSYLDKMLLALKSRGIRVRVYSRIDLTFANLRKFSYSKASGEYVCRVDDDHILHPAYLEKLQSFMDNCPNAGAAGGVILHPDVPGFEFSESDFVKILCQAREKGILNTILQLKNHPTDEPLQVPDLYSSFMVRRHVLKRVGGIAMCYSACSYREETDLTLRMAFGGYGQFIVPTAIVWHARADYGGERKSQNVWEKLRLKNEKLFRERLGNWCSDPVKYFRPLWDQALLKTQLK